MIHLTGLETPGCEAKVRGDGSGALKSAWIIDRGFKRERGDEAHTRGAHQALADRILVRQLARAVIELTEGVVELESHVEHGQERMR
jgi:hypothetical protein